MNIAYISAAPPSAIAGPASAAGAAPAPASGCNKAFSASLDRAVQTTGGAPPQQTVLQAKRDRPATKTKEEDQESGGGAQAKNSIATLPSNLLPAAVPAPPTTASFGTAPQPDPGSATAAPSAGQTSATLSSLTPAPFADALENNASPSTSPYARPGATQDAMQAGARFLEAHAEAPALTPPLDPSAPISTPRSLAELPREQAPRQATTPAAQPAAQPVNHRPAEPAGSSPQYAASASSGGPPQTVPVTGAAVTPLPAPSLAEAARPASAKPGVPALHHAVGAALPAGGSTAAAQTAPDTGSNGGSQSGPANDRETAAQQAPASAHAAESSSRSASSTASGLLPAPASQAVEDAPFVAASAAPLPAKTVPPNVPQQGAAGPSTAPAEEPSPALNSVQVLSRISGTEMRVGVRSEDFGSVSVAASLSPGSMVAQISLDHGALSRALAAHLPGMEEKLGTALGVNARVELRDTAQAGAQGSMPSFSGGASGNSEGSRGTAQPHSGGYGRGQPEPAGSGPAAVSPGDPVSAGPPTGARLSIHV